MIMEIILLNLFMWEDRKKNEIEREFKCET